MKDNEKLELLLERFYNRYNKFNKEVLKMLGETVAKFSNISPSEAHKLAQQLRLGYDLDKIIEELSRITHQSVVDIYKTLDEVARQNVEFGKEYYKAKNKAYIDYKNNESLQKYVKALSYQSSNTFKSFSKTSLIGFSVIDLKTGKKVFKPLKKVYNNLIDECVYKITSGVTDYQSAMRNTIKQLADSGVKVHEYKTQYESGYSRRIDSSVRQNVLDAVRQVNIKVQEEVGKDFGADGVEISAHTPCAVDHQPIQGRQFTFKEFNRLNGDPAKNIKGELERSIGTLNCRHFVFQIVLGVLQPQYSDKELQRMNDESNRVVEYNGKKYTKYEATQVQRKIETAIRKQKDRQIVARYSGDNDEVRIAQQKISLLTNEYKKFSDAANLNVYKKRLTVSGYRKIRAK